MILIKALVSGLKFLMTYALLNSEEFEIKHFCRLKVFDLFLLFFKQSELLFEFMKVYNSGLGFCLLNL